MIANPLGSPMGADPKLEERIGAVLDQRMNWVRCAHRMPKQRVRVFVRIVRFSFNPRIERHLETFIAQWTGREWLTDYGSHPSYDAVSHWMPLPEPPRENE